MATAYELGWSTVTNGDLIRLAELEGDGLLITTDTNLRYQQDLESRSIAILVLTTTSWPRMRAVTGDIQAAVTARRHAQTPNRASAGVRILPLVPSG